MTNKIKIRAWEHFEQYGKVNGVGESLIGKNGKIDANGKPCLYITFEKLTCKKKDVPVEFEGISCIVEVLGKILPCKGV